MIDDSKRRDNGLDTSRNNTRGGGDRTPGGEHRAPGGGDRTSGGGDQKRDYKQRLGGTKTPLMPLGDGSK